MQLNRKQQQHNWDRVNLSSLIYPLFVKSGSEEKEEISSMPGIYRLSLIELMCEVKKAYTLGIKKFLLFGISNQKDPLGTFAFAKDSVVVLAVQNIKESYPDSTVMTDVCLCAYTDHGHCGVIQLGETYRDHRATLHALAEMAVTHAAAGADVVAPSAMAEGQVKAIKRALIQKGLSTTMIMGYSAKYASHFYGPFRDAAQSAPQFGDRSGYQLDYNDASTAFDKIRDDIGEGADIVMVKPALGYLDIISQAKARFAHPLAVYNVSGEYAMVKHGVNANIWEEEGIVSEIIHSFYRAGADLIITYHALDIADWKQKGQNEKTNENRHTVAAG